MYNRFKECDLGLGTHYLWNSLQANFIPNTSQLHELKIFQNTSKYSKAPSPRNAKTRHFGLRYRLRRTPLGHVGPFQHTEKTAVLTEKKHSPKRSRHVLGQVLRPLQICSLPKIFSAIRLHLDFVPIQIEHVTMTLHSRSFQVVWMFKCKKRQILEFQLLYSSMFLVNGSSTHFLCLTDAASIDL